jgi:3-hydroxyisobutyrate dehydrogenase-like beta-hydroxyacid dehydrogenase
VIFTQPSPWQAEKPLSSTSRLTRPSQPLLAAVPNGPDMSTVLPATSLREPEAYSKRGVEFLDAPVFGSKNESAKAELWIMAAGKRDTFEKVKPVLQHLGQTVHYFGNNGNATAMKLVGNLIVALELKALSEGLVLARKAGLDLNTVMEVVKVADFRSPLLVSNGQNILKRDFLPVLHSNSCSRTLA